MSRKMMTPVCASQYIYIFEANTKFDPDGTWSIECIMDDSPEWKELVSVIDREYEEYYTGVCAARGGKKLKRCEHKPWKTREDGSRVFVAKNNRVGVKDGKEFTTKVTVVAGNPPKPITEADLEGKLGAGTRVRVGFVVNYWVNDAQGVGVSARLQLVQIVEPKYFDGLGGFDLSDTSDNWFKPKGKGSAKVLTKDESPDEFFGLEVHHVLEGQ